MYVIKIMIIFIYIVNSTNTYLSLYNIMLQKLYIMVFVHYFKFYYFSF